MVASPAPTGGLVPVWTPATFTIPPGGRRSVTTAYTIRNDSDTTIPAGALTIVAIFNQPFSCDEVDNGPAWALLWPKSNGGTATYGVAIPPGGTTQQIIMRPFTVNGNSGDTGTASIMATAAGLDSATATIYMTVGP